ncbi:MAG TPA: hypothetical protein PLO44_03105 [Candidatus Paceibacterota bacterium]|nr:hypothetical protein [Candidatus Paceibacterota bacterium]
MAKTKRSIFRRINVVVRRRFDNYHWKRVSRKDQIFLNKKDILEIESQAGFYRNRMPD